MKRTTAFACALCFVALLCTTATADNTVVTYYGCQDGCPFGDQKCQDYCKALFAPCFDDCKRADQEFVPKCVAGPQGFPHNGTRAAHCRDLLYIVSAQCRDNCRAIKRKVEYPNWMGEQKCEYDCQKWNPASRSCIGAKMNGCSW